MEIEEITRRHARIYRCPDDIENFKIRLRLREIDGDFQEEATLSWQEKRYGPHERDFYKEKVNCSSDLEKQYHEDVKNMVENDEIVYTYTKNDNYILDDIPVTASKNVNTLPERVTQEGQDDDDNEQYDYERHLLKSIGNPFLADGFEYMYIMADFGEYYKDTWLKCEYVLCTIKYDPARKIMEISSDFTLMKPYELKVHADTTKRFAYWVENASMDDVNNDELLKEVEILTKLAVHEKRLRRCNKTLGDFRLVPKNRLHVHVFLEILKAEGFERENIYVRYFVDLPPNWTKLEGDELQGVTPSCRGGYFGFPLEMSFEVNLQAPQESNPRSPFVYFEVVSKDTWSRYRSEGLTYRPIRYARSGRETALLGCCRIGGGNTNGRLRRHFLGDAGCCEDPAWIGLPHTTYKNGVLNKCGGETWCTGGRLEVRLSVVRQSDVVAAPDDPPGRPLEKLHDAGLMQSVEQVLEAFKRARDAMLAARRSVR